MTIQAIKDKFNNSYLVTQLSSLLQQSRLVYRSNIEDSQQEIKAIPVLTTAGACYGLAGRALFMLATTASISIPSLIFYGLMGSLVGMTVSTPIIGTFLSRLNRRMGIVQQHPLPPPVLPLNPPTTEFHDTELT